MIPVLTRNYDASADVPANVFVVPSPVVPGAVVPAAAAADKIIGTSTNIATASGEPCDVQHLGVTDLKCGGAVSFGDLLTSDANGAAVVAAAGNRVGAVALADGAAGDIIPALLVPGLA